MIMTRSSRFVASVVAVKPWSSSRRRERNNPTLNEVARCRETQVLQRRVFTLAVLGIAQGTHCADGLGCMLLEA